MGNIEDRRSFLKQVLFSSATITATANSLSKNNMERIIPYLIPPQEQVTGVSTYIASICKECPSGCGILVKNRDGFAIKLEGNPLHPINKGKLCARGQAALQGLYHPDRISSPLIKMDSGRFESIAWDKAMEIFVARLNYLVADNSARAITFITSLITGSMRRLIGDWLGKLGSNSTRHIMFEAFALNPIIKANDICFNTHEIAQYNIGEADVIISFGADFLETYISPVEYSYAFSNIRTYKNGREATFIQIEPRLSLTGSNADKWIKIRSGSEYILALGLARLILEARGYSFYRRHVANGLLDKLYSKLKPFTLEYIMKVTEIDSSTINGLLNRLLTARQSIILGTGVAGQTQYATLTETAVNILNYLLGNINKTIRFGNNHSLSNLTTYSQLLSIVKEMESGDIPLLLIYNSNPVSSIPQSSGFYKAMGEVPYIISFSNFMDETTIKANLILPDHHYLESWGDNQPYSNIFGLHQPAMEPLHNTRSIGDVLLNTVTLNLSTYKDYLYSYWRDIYAKNTYKEGGFNEFWEISVENGYYKYKMDGSMIEVALSNKISSLDFDIDIYKSDKRDNKRYRLILYPSIRNFDGRGANRPWLQELPDPVTKVVWGLYAEINPATGKRLRIEQGDWVRITADDNKYIDLPVYFYYGIREDCIALPIGHNTSQSSNPLDLLPSVFDELAGSFSWLNVFVDIMPIIPKGKVKAYIPLADKERLVTLEGEIRQKGRKIIQTYDTSKPDSLADSDSRRYKDTDMYPQHEHPFHRFGMVIDLNKCIGCSACVVACYAENNIPVVGKEDCAKGREMSWIRIERYFEGTDDDPMPMFIPVLCQHCDNAPCEPVCPVHATYHNKDGLNIQIYNRCVGTRYCSNNCPYKVRRFNWRKARWKEPLDKQLNPDLSIRSVGVMEKCTFCIQRIREAKDRVKDHKQGLKDGDIIPACSQTCPTNAIVFGDLKDPDSMVSKLKGDPRGYRVFEELNTKPAVIYLKRVIKTWLT